MEHKSYIKIPKEELDENERLLKLSNVNLHDMGYAEDETVQTYTAKFPDGMEADIKLCSGTNDFFIDPVLYNENGGEECLLDVGGTLLDEFEFETNDNMYKVQIVSE